MSEIGLKKPLAFRVLISHQGCVPIYRKGLFDRLKNVPDIDYVVAYGDPPSGTGYLVAQPPYSFSSLQIVNREFGVAGKHVIWQPLVRRFWHEFDAAILGDEVKYLSHTAIIIAAKLRRKPVILWGFGYRPDFAHERKAGYLGKLTTGLGKLWRRLLVRSVDGYLVYTLTGAQRLAAQGYPAGRIAILRNTVDLMALRELGGKLTKETDSEIRARLGMPPKVPVLLHFGRFLPEKRVDMLIEYVRHSQTRGRQIGLLIFGKGVEEKKLREAARDVPDVVIRSHDDLDLARAHRIAEAVVIPGFIGLAITHAFAHGLPLITRAGQSHSPEIDYLEPGRNGLLAPESSEAFFSTLDGFLDNPELRARLRAGARASAQHLDMDHMAEVFDGMVRRCLGLKPVSSTGRRDVDDEQ